MDKQLREQLKHDKFVEEVGHTVDYISTHKDTVQKYGLAIGAVVLLLAGGWAFFSYQRSARQEDLRKAQAILEAPTGDVYKSVGEKDAAALKALTEVAQKHSGSREGTIAQLQAATLLCDQGKEAECEKGLQAAANSGDTEAASLGKFALANYYQSAGKIDETEKLLRGLMDHPTAMVSKEQATLALARAIAKTKPADAKKLAEGLQSSTRPPVSRAAVGLVGELMTASK